MGCGWRGESQLAVVTLLPPKVAKGDVLGRLRARADPCAPHWGRSALRAWRRAGAPRSQDPGRGTHLGPKDGRCRLCPPGPGPAAWRRPPRGWALGKPTACRRAPRRGWPARRPGTASGARGWQAGAGPARRPWRWPWPWLERPPGRGAGAVAAPAAGRPQPAASSQSGNSCPGCQSRALRGSWRARRRPPRPSTRRRAPPGRWGAWWRPRAGRTPASSSRTPGKEERPPRTR